MENGSLPHNSDYEESILSGCIRDAGIRSEVFDLLSPEDFYSGAHAKIFKAVAYLEKNGDPVDLVSLTTCLRKYGQLEAVGGAARLSEIVSACPIVINAEYVAREVKALSVVRKAISTMQEGIRRCMCANGDAREVIDRIQADVLSIEMPAKSSFTTGRELADQAIDRYMALSAGESGARVPTGFGIMDTLCKGGFAASKLVVLAARPSVGKTAFMQNLVRNQVERGFKAGVFELEMDKDELADRWFGQVSGMNPLAFTGPGGPNAEQSKRLVDACREISAWNVLIDDAPADIGELKRRARLMRKAGCDIIYIDQLSKIGGNRNLKSFDRFTAHVEELAFLKKELRIPVVLLCQVNRKAEERLFKRPTMADLKNTGQIEEDADIVFLGSRRTVKDGGHDRDIAEWEIAKHRGGPTCRCFFDFIDRLTEFREMDHDTWKRLTNEK